MAYATTTTTSFNVFDRVRATISNLRSAAQERTEYTRTYKELSRLTNRELADIGLRRCDIELACSGKIAR
ncbi:DUF1127 domain-containing protein [Shimia abyssi]|uniref:Uncharacterized protein YjiS (DUF1127 family) n=1 Tax=Shimia abyssi TaxID=1662395 RepID=A0A2P8FA04_9RHOB|nr:DUF1127 domain-containing protein [Shimia abyssi]PSL18540.1 uncharacterized protein YjiS (DUF1127 family) [Shimia abyssi]